MQKLGQEFTTKARELYEISEQLKQLEERKAIVQEELKTISNNEAAHGGGFRFFYQVRKGSIDYKSAAMVHYSAEDLEPFRKEEVKYWKLDLELQPL